MGILTNLLFSRQVVCCVLCVICVKMDRLSVENQESLKKMNTERLRVKLVRAGMDEDKAMEMDRAEMLEAVALTMINEELMEASQVPLPRDEAGSVTSEGGSGALRIKELEVEERRAEREERRAEREAEERRAEREERRVEREERRAEREAEEKRAEREREAEERRAAREFERQKELKRMELEQAKISLEMRRIEAQAVESNAEEEGSEDGEGAGSNLRAERVDNTLAAQTKRYGDIMRHVLPKMPAENSELPQFFETVEKLFHMYEVPDGVKAKLLIPLLTAQAKALVNRMSVENLANYAELKKFLLTEYKLTPREYKARFDTAVKNADETYILFAARLRNLLTYYLSSRGVQDFDKFCDLIISDRLKASLPQGPLNYVLSLEGESWFDPNKVASLADVFVNNRPPAGPKAQDGRAVRIATAAPTETRGHPGTYGARGGRYVPGRGGNNTSPAIRCYKCNGLGHLAKDCASNRGGAQGSYRGNVRGGGSSNYYQGSNRGHRGGAHVNLCSTLGAPRLQSKEMGVQCTDDDFQVNLITQPRWEFSEFPSVDVTTVKSLPMVRVYPLQYVEVTVAGYECVALEDSGCQIPIVSNRLFGWCCDGAIGKVDLHGFGKDHTVQAPLVNLTVRLRDGVCESGVGHEIPIVCAVTNLGTTDYDVILPADVVRELQAPSVSVSTVTYDTDNVESVTEEVQVGNLADSENVLGADSLAQEELEGDVSDLISEQKEDPTLEPCWNQAAAGKGGFTIHRGLLYHQDKVEGQPVCQLCVPQSRRDNVLRLAHESVFGGHLGERKTRERIRLSFYWPELRKSVLHHVQSCCNCQLRSRPITTDRVPITPVTRADVPFQVLNMDCIGPLDPPSAQGHKYCLCIVDNCTRWPSVYMLRSLTAKAVCEALIDLFTMVGVPKVIISDRGTNFTSQLTQEMLKSLGCSPRFNTPGHPEASGMVERFNQTCKNMLSHVVQQHQRMWHRYVPLLVWALREVPNATTGVSPYMLVYGRTPRGPLTVLKEMWAGEREIPPNLGKPVEDYLQDLRGKLEEVAEYAKSHTEKEQTRYVTRYNLRARHKTFHEGDQVIVLAPDSGGKLCNRWQGPGTIAKVMSKNSYLVDLGSNGTRHVHANKIRRFVARINGCSVINECDDDFGHVLTPATDVLSCALPSVCIDESKLSHLESSQRQELLRLLDEFQDRFSDTPGLCDAAVHRIQTTAEFVPRQMRPYRVPDALKPDVDRQIRQLLDLGLIRPSNSPMASPIVCVAKKDGGVRIAVDYRYLNSFTVGDAYPMATIDDVLRKIGHACYISTFDAKSGYWQIPVAEESSWLTAFVTHDGLYEWLRMPFGLKNAGATFVRAVRTVLRPVQAFCDSYVDDMGVGSSDWRSHLGHVREFLMIMRKSGMTLNLAKCEFGKAEVKFVGRLVGSGTHRADPQRLEGLAKMDPPHTKKELRKILGAFGYYREYIPHFADIAKPLTDLTQQNVPSNISSRWSVDCQLSFERLRSELVSSHVLRIPNVGKPFTLHTDASGRAVGATLGQLDDSGVEQPLAFASQKLSDTQASWATIEKEAYAVIWALNRFRNLIFGSLVSVYCDHNPLQYVRECAPKSAKLLRWSLALQEFNIDFHYKKGCQNVVADWLSRQ